MHRSTILVSTPASGYTPAIPLQHTYNENESTSQTSIAQPFASSVLAGSTLIVSVGWYDNASANVSVSQGTNGAFTAVTAQDNDSSSGAISHQIFRFSGSAAITAGSSLITATFSSSVDYPWIHITEVPGMLTASPIDGTVSNHSGSGNATSGALVTTNAADFLYCSGSTWKTWSGVGAGFTVLDITAQDGNVAMYQNVNATGSYTGSASPTQGAGWIMQMAAFKVS